MKPLTDHQDSVQTLGDDLPPGVRSIAQYTREEERRIRHLIRAHGFPHFKIGGKIYSRKSWLRSYYGGEVAPNGGA